MKKRTWLVALPVALAFALGGVGCKPYKKVCKKLDECNYLNTSVDDCVDTYENEADNLTDSQQDDLETMLDNCLDFESCSMFATCMGI